MSTMRVGHIELLNWKNFQHVEANLTDRTFLIGPNASGKSNFLDAFRFLRDVAEKGLQVSVSKRGGLSAIRCLSARRRPEVVVDISLIDESGVRIWRYRLELEQEKAGQHRCLVKVEEVWLNDESIFRGPAAQDMNDLDARTETAMESFTVNKKFREVSEFLSSISYQHIIPQVVRDPSGFSSQPVANDPFGRDFLLRIFQTNQKTLDSRLKKINLALKIAVPQLDGLEMVQEKSSGRVHLKGRLSHWRHNPTTQDESQLSDGTLRLFGLLWTLFEGQGPLLLEEPELSLHKDIVRRLPEVFDRIQRLGKKRRQIIISTHSQELLSDLSITGPQVLRLEPGEHGTQILAPSVQDSAQMKAGLTAAEVLMPRSAPKNLDQLAFSFD